MPLPLFQIKLSNKNAYEIGSALGENFSLNISTLLFLSLFPEYGLPSLILTFLIKTGVKTNSFIFNLTTAKTLSQYLLQRKLTIMAVIEKCILDKHCHIPLTGC